MKLFFEYLKDKYKQVVLFSVVFLIFIVSFLLYHLPLMAIIYPMLLCVFIIVCFGVSDFIRVKQKHIKLQNLKDFEAEMIEESIFDGTLTDNDYKQIILSLKEKIVDIKSQDFANYNDMVDYYTVWAHQIKTPISSMKLTLQGEDTKLSRRLSADLFRTEQYVEMVLAFLRLGTETGDYVFKSYNIDDIIRPCIKKFATEFIERKLSLDYKTVNFEVVTDEKWLSFVIEQLLSNALKYTKNGGIKIFAYDKNTLIISDTGIGIAPEDLPRIFEKGYTGYNGRIDKTASGLGLYLCKLICDNLKINIDIKSQIGKGTVCTLDFRQKNKMYE